MVVKSSQLSSALQWQVSLQKLSKGTKFAILVSREYLGDKLTGQGNVEAIHIMTDGKSYYGIQAANGRYYDKQGETLGKGFTVIHCNVKRVFRHHLIQIVDTQ